MKAGYITAITLGYAFYFVKLSVRTSYGLIIVTRAHALK